MLNTIRVAVLLALISTAAFAHDISGKWTFDVQTDAGSGSPTFVFKQAGEKLTGTYSGAFGSADLAGTVKGDEIEFTIEAGPADQKVKIVYKGKIASDSKMAGNVDLGGMGSGTWSGAKQ